MEKKICDITREDELWFFLECCKYCKSHYEEWKDTLEYLQYESLTPRVIINANPEKINYKRAWYLLEKWCRNDWYEYGVTLDLGWMTENGRKEYDYIKSKLLESK